jgi:hypothetical protein
MDPLVSSQKSVREREGGKEVAAWVATSKRICGPVYVFTPRINLVAHPVGHIMMRRIASF